MLDNILEGIRTCVLGFVLGYLWWLGRKEQLFDYPSWRYLVVGFALVFLGGVFSITDNFPSLNKYVIVGDTIYQAFFAQTIGAMFGSALVLIGFWYWLPLIPKLRQVEQELKWSNEKLETLVVERTTELKRADEYLQQQIQKHKQAAESLQESEAKNRALLEAIPDLMFRISGDGAYLEFIPAKGSEPLLPPSEFLGRTMHEVIPPKVAQLAMRYIEQALQSGALQIFEYQLHIQGELRHYEARLVVSGPDELLAVVRDITQRKIRDALIEAERARIARDLHDGLAQSLYLLGLKLDYHHEKEPGKKINIHLQNEAIETYYITPLSDVELDILRLVAHGLSNNDIAEQLGLAESTVGNRLSMIFTKLNVKNRVQAALYALRRGVASLDDEET